MITLKTSVLVAALSFTALTPVYASAPASVSVVSTGDLTTGQIDQAFRTILKHPDGIEAALQVLEEGAKGNAHQFLLVSHLRWRLGHLEKALDAVNSAINLDPDGVGELLKARLLDASGKPEEAATWYQDAISKIADPTVREFIQLRQTMLEVDGRSAEALVSLAATRDQAFRNRAAVTLSLLGDTSRASELYKVNEASGRLFQQHIRLADWALGQKEYDAAADHAWKAWESARARADERYALSVLGEVHKKGNSLPGLLDDLNDKPELKSFRFDILLELGRYDEAIQQTDSSANDRSSRHELIKLYELAGKTSEMLAEYDRAIKAEPAYVPWFEGLAIQLMNTGAPDEAEAVWQRFEKLNVGNIDALVAGGEVMRRMGMSEQAVAMVQRASGSDPVSALEFVFEARLEQGARGQAAEALNSLMEIVPVGSRKYRELADGWERVGNSGQALEILQQLDAQEPGLGYDDRMRLAWLMGQSGKKREALKIWQDIWIGVASPARRSFAETQLMKLASELNELGNIVVELEDRLEAGTARKSEIELLVRIYVEADDPYPAVEVTEEYARRSDVSEIERLEQVGRIYQRLGDYNKYDSVLRELSEIDREGREEHIRNIILNLLSNSFLPQGTNRMEQVSLWLDELRKIDREAVEGEFEAGILSIGGDVSGAIESYRLALAEKPERSDNLLLMSDLMKDAGRADEAVGILQYAAEHADSDNAFVVAIDGIINMIGARGFGQQLSSRNKAVMQWARRIVLERLAGKEDKYYLYTLLAELAEETGDQEGQLVAIEGSLPLAGTRRSSTLRELITLSTPDFNPGVGGRRAGDRSRQLTYGRRLIGLDQQLPPEIYIDLGRALLAEGDSVGAEKAFGMIRDITGLLDVDKTRAKAFEEAGYLDSALNAYNRALSRNQKDMELLLKTALLRERNNQDEVAANWYEQGVSQLLKSQPETWDAEAVQAPGLQLQGPIELSVTRDYRNWFEPMAQGLIATANTGDSSVLDHFKRLFDAELARVAGQITGGERLNTYSRLDHIADFYRRLAIATDNVGQALQMDEKLQRVIGHDQDYLRKINRIYSSQGRGRTVEVDFSLLANAQELAMADGDIESAVQLSRLSGSEENLADVFVEVFRMGELAEALGRGSAVLSQQEFRRVTNQATAEGILSAAAIVELIAEHPEAIVRAEAALGRSLVPFDQVLGALIAFDPNQNMTRFWRSTENIQTWLTATASPEQIVMWFARETAKPADFRGYGRFMNVLSIVLDKPLQQATREKLADALLRVIDETDADNIAAFAPLVGHFLNFEVHQDNRSMVLGAARALQAKKAGGFGLDSVLISTWQGEGLDQLMDMLTILGGRPGSWLGILAPSRYEDQIATELEQLARGERLASSRARVLFDLAFDTGIGRGDDPAVSERKANALPFFIANDPTENRYQLELADAFLTLGKIDDLLEVLRSLYISTPDEDLRAALYLAYLQSSKSSEAEAVNGEGSRDFSGNEGKIWIEGRARSANRFEVSAQSLLARISGIESEQGSPFIIEREAKLKNLALEVAAHTREGQPEKARASFRAIWRTQLGHSNAPADQPVLQIPYHQLLTMSVQVPGKLSKIPLLDLVARQSWGADELDRIQRSVSVDEWDGLDRLYGWRAQALVNSGKAEAWLQDNFQKLASGNISRMDASLLIVLADQMEIRPITSQIQALETWVGRTAAIDDQVLLSAAHSFARAERTDIASDLYRILTTRLINHDEFSRSFTYDRPTPALLTLTELISEITREIPGPEGHALAAELLNVAVRQDGHEASLSMHSALRLKAHAILHGESGVFDWIAKNAPELLELPEVSVETIPVLVMQAKVLVAAGRHTEAQRRSDLLLISKFPTEPASTEAAQIIAELDRIYGLGFDISSAGNPAMLVQLLLEKSKRLASAVSD